VVLCDVISIKAKAIADLCQLHPIFILAPNLPSVFVQMVEDTNHQLCGKRVCHLNVSKFGGEFSVTKTGGWPRCLSPGIIEKLLVLKNDADADELIIMLTLK
jgi:hypothetical protein